MENKEIWRYTSLVNKHCAWPEHGRPIDKTVHPHLPKEGWSRYGQKLPMYIIYVAAKIYNGQVLKLIEREIAKKFWKNQNGFRRNRSMTWEIVTIR